MGTFVLERDKKMGYFKEHGKGKYRLFADAGYNADGKRIRKTKVITASGPREAKKKLAEFEVEVSNTNFTDVKNLSFGEFVEMWRDNHAKVALSASTLEIYNIILDSSLLPHFKKQKLKDIKTLHIVKFFNDEKNKNKGSLEKKYNLLLNIFKKAVEWEVIATTPMEKVDKPKVKKKKKDFYDKEELQLLFKKMDSLLPYQRLMIKLAAIGGLRRGEILALTANDIEGNEVHIWRSMQNTQEKGLVLKETKTGEERTVTFPDDIIKEMKALHNHQLRMKLQAGNLWEGFNGEIMLFANEFGVPFRPNSVTTFWNRFVTREKLKKISFHDLRHSSASLLISEGINMKIVQQRLGHKDIKTTLNIYSHVTKKDDEKASEVLGSILK